MPVARIYTRFPDESAGLAARLRAHGYVIEIVDPAAFHVTPADLEIQVDRLRAGEAITKAVRFARERDAQVFVGAGFALEDEAQRALRGATAGRASVFTAFSGLFGIVRRMRRAGAEAHAIRAARRQQKLDAELAREAERKRRAETAAAERAERERREREEEGRRAAEREAIRARQREEESRAAARREAELAHRREEEQRRREEEDRVAAERAAQLAAQRQVEERQREEHAAAAARLAAEAAESRRVEDEAARVERERQAALMARIVEQRELAQQERLVEQPALPAPRPIPVNAAQPIPVKTPRVVPAPPRGTELERATKRAFVGAAAIAIFAALGWGAYENRTPAAPLSNSQMVHGAQIQQDVPFGAAMIKPAAKPPANMVRPPAVQAQRRTQTRPQDAQGQPPAQASKRPATRPQHKQRFADDTDVIAEDQVVYHGVPKRAPQNSSAKAQNVKKISDTGGDQ